MISSVFNVDNTKTSLNREISMLTRLLTVAKTFVVHNNLIMNDEETTVSLTNFNNLEKDYITSGISSFVEFRKTGRYSKYVELNPYVKDLLAKVGETDEINPYTIRRILEPFAIVYYNSDLFSKLEFVNFISVYREESDYALNNFQVEAYTGYEMFASMFAYNILISTIFKYISKINNNKITVTTTDIYLLDNQLLSYGFKLNNSIELSNKAEFTLNLLKLYRTKGSFTNLELINTVLANGRLNIHTTYLYFERERWILEGKPASKVGFYRFLSVDTNKGETFLDVYNNSGTTGSRSYPFSFFTEEDASWTVDEDELYENGVVFCKSKYFNIFEDINYSLYSDTRQLAQSFSKEVFELSPNNFNFFFSSFSNLSMYEAFKFYNLALLKETNETDLSIFTGLTFESPDMLGKRSVGVRNRTNNISTTSTKQELIDLINSEITDYKSLTEKLAISNQSYKYDDHSQGHTYKSVITDLREFNEPVRNYTFSNDPYVETLDNKYNGQATLVVEQDEYKEIKRNVSSTETILNYTLSDIDFEIITDTQQVRDTMEYYKSFHSAINTPIVNLQLRDYSIGVKAYDERAGTAGKTKYFDDNMGLSFVAENDYLFKKLKNISAQAPRFILSVVANVPKMIYRTLSQQDRFRGQLYQYALDKKTVIMLDYVRTISGKTVYTENSIYDYALPNKFTLFYDFDNFDTVFTEKGDIIDPTFYNSFEPDEARDIILRRNMFLINPNAMVTDTIMNIGATKRRVDSTLLSEKLKNISAVKNFTETKFDELIYDPYLLFTRNKFGPETMSRVKKTIKYFAFSKYDKLAKIRQLHISNTNNNSIMSDFVNNISSELVIGDIQPSEFLNYKDFELEQQIINNNDGLQKTSRDFFSAKITDSFEITPAY